MATRSTSFVLIMLLGMTSFWAASVPALCECGYSSTIGGSPAPYLFTDLIESDFLHIRNVSLDTDWRRQNFSVTPQAGRGPYGMNFTVQSVVSNPILDANDWSGPGAFAGDPGVQLSVAGGVPSNGYVQVAEMDSSREDLLWGSYRAAMKLTLTPGTCAAFFWYFNDSQEIDMEFLSSEFNVQNNIFPVNLVLQSPQSVKAGYNAALTGNFKIANLPFNPATGYHEYRIDFVPGLVIFYADGQILATMNNTAAVPDQAGHMILTQWSNGNPLWSAGPPPEEAVIAVSYVKAYFNSSNPDRLRQWKILCSGSTSANDSICTIPDQLVAPDPSGSNGNVTGNTFFFSNAKNMTPNQIVYHRNHAGKRATISRWSSRISAMLLLSIVFAVSV